MCQLCVNRVYVSNQRSIVLQSLLLGIYICHQSKVKAQLHTFFPLSVRVPEKKIWSYWFYKLKLIQSYGKHQ